MYRRKCRLGIRHRFSLLGAVATLMFMLAACSRVPNDPPYERFVQYALNHNVDWRGDSIRGNWPDSVPRPQVAFDSLHDEIAGANYLGSFSILPLNAVSYELYRVDVIGDTAQEYLLHANHCNFSMRNWFELHFFEGEAAQPPLASAEFSANFVDKMAFRKLSQVSHPDLVVYWDQRSLAYANAGIDILQVTRDSIYELFSQDTLFFDWNYFGKDTLSTWPVSLSADQAYRETARFSSIRQNDNAPCSLQLIRQKEVVQALQENEVTEITQWQAIQHLGTDTLRFDYDEKAHQFVPQNGPH